MPLPISNTSNTPLKFEQIPTVSLLPHPRGISFFARLGQLPRVSKVPHPHLTTPQPHQAFPKASRKPTRALSGLGVYNHTGVGSRAYLPRERRQVYAATPLCPCAVSSVPLNQVFQENPHGAYQRQQGQESQKQNQIRVELLHHPTAFMAAWHRARGRDSAKYSSASKVPRPLTSTQQPPPPAFV